MCVEKEKEWSCHVQFVEEIALKLARRYRASKEIVSIAAILHDIGRDKEIANEDHRDAGVRIAREFLTKFDLSKLELELILTCIKNHGGDEMPKTVEEKVTIAADSASKIIYHQPFMLMVKKTKYFERAEWGLKYLDKGFKKILFPDFKKELEATYREYRKNYLGVLGNV